MKFIYITALLTAFTALADKKPVVEQNTRSFYNDSERKAWNPVELPAGEALATIDVEKDYDVAVRRFYLMPIVGGEINTVGGTFWRDADGSFGGVRQVSAVYAAPTFGGLAGMRLGWFNLGARYQGSMYSDRTLDGLMLHKVYGEIGFNARRGRSIFNGYLDAGWAFATSRNQGVRNGVGAKAGIGVDFLLTRFLSVGPALEVDVQTYRIDPNWVAAYGGSALVRVGIQL